MRIGGLQKVTLIDYPGKIGATVFTQGCNFRCPYCHNPELVDAGLYGPVIPEAEVISFLEKRRGKLDAVTVTGGEPTLHQDLEGFLAALKAMGYLVKVDTNGSNPDLLARLITRGLVDYLAMDIKGPLKKYGAIASVAVDTSRILRSIELITSSGVAHEFRTTIVRSQLTPRDLVSIARMIPKARLYCLQHFAPTKVLDDSFLAAAPYSPQELSTIRKSLEKELVPVIIR
ncbi:MAG: anaerobic ribonucleoside-triphosphate reductase activating protein [Syntrophales bacterium]